MRFLLLPIILLLVPICSIALRTLINMGDGNRETDDDTGGDDVNYDRWEDSDYKI